MAWKVFGLGIVLAGIVNTGAFVLHGTDNPQVALVGFGALLLGAALYLAGATVEVLIERATRDRHPKDE